MTYEKPGQRKKERSSEKYMKLLTLNIHSHFDKMSQEQFDLALQELTKFIVAEKVDIVALQECSQSCEAAIVEGKLPGKYVTADRGRTFVPIRTADRGRTFVPIRTADKGPSPVPARDKGPSPVPDEKIGDEGPSPVPRDEGPSPVPRDKGPSPVPCRLELFIVVFKIEERVIKVMCLTTFVTCAGCERIPLSGNMSSTVIMNSVIVASCFSWCLRDIRTSVSHHHFSLI